MPRKPANGAGIDRESEMARVLEFSELKLLNGSEVSCAGVDRDAGQEPFQLQTLDASGLLHDVRVGKIVAAHLDNVNYRLSDIVACHYREILTITLREILRKGRRQSSRCLGHPSTGGLSDLSHKLQILCFGCFPIQKASLQILLMHRHR